MFDAKKGTHIGTLDDSEAKDIFGLFGAPASVLSEEQAAKRRQRLAEAHDRLAGARSAAAAHSVAHGVVHTIGRSRSPEAHTATAAVVGVF